MSSGNSHPVRALVPDRKAISVFVCVCGCDGLPSLEISLESVESHADTTQHTAEPLNRKAGLRLGKDSTGVGVKNLLGQAVV